MLVLVAQGLSNGEIAERLVLNPATARTHVSRSTTELGARDRAQRRRHVGHGIGLEVHDVPVLQPSASASEFGGAGANDQPVEAGMVFCVETPYYVLDAFGMVVEDTVVVTPACARYLTDLPRTLT